MSWAGFAVCEELQAVYLLASDYATKQSVADNAARCIAEELGIGYVTITDLVIADADKSAELLEQAEERARDSVSGCYGVDDGYTLFEQPIQVTPKEQTIENAVKALSKEYRQSYTAMLAMFYAYQGMNSEHDDKRALCDFSKLVKRMQETY